MSDALPTRSTTTTAPDAALDAVPDAAPAAAAAAPAPRTGGDPGPGRAAAPAADRGTGTGDGLARLEEQGEVAADYLEELLDIVDLDGDIDIDVEDGRAALSVVADPVATRSLRRLAGPSGEVLEALQELTRLAVQARTGERSRLLLDVAGYRAERRSVLVAAAQDAVATVRSTGQPLRMEPMNSFERKVVHDVVAAAGLGSDSEGVEPARRVVVQPDPAS